MEVCDGPLLWQDALKLHDFTVWLKGSEHQQEAWDNKEQRPNSHRDFCREQP